MAPAPWGGTQEGRRGSSQGSLAYTDGLCPVDPGVPACGRGHRGWGAGWGGLVRAAGTWNLSQGYELCQVFSGSPCTFGMGSGGEGDGPWVGWLHLSGVPGRQMMVPAHGEPLWPPLGRSLTLGSNDDGLSFITRIPHPFPSHDPECRVSCFASLCGLRYTLSPACLPRAAFAERLLCAGRVGMNRVQFWEKKSTWC